MGHWNAQQAFSCISSGFPCFLLEPVDLLVDLTSQEVSVVALQVEARWIPLAAQLTSQWVLKSISQWFLRTFSSVPAASYWQETAFNNSVNLSVIPGAAVTSPLKTGGKVDSYFWIPGNYSYFFTCLSMLIFTLDQGMLEKEGLFAYMCVCLFVKYPINHKAQSRGF